MTKRLLWLMWISRLTRKYGVPRGIERVLNLIYPRTARSGSNEAIFEFYDGIWLKVDLSSFLDRRLFIYGYYNKYVEFLVQNILKEGCVAFDCGANIGMYSLRMAKSVGRNGQVISIEPHDLARARLEANIALNRYGDRVTVIPCALSKSCGSTIFHYPPSDHANQGNASLYKKGDDWMEKCVEVKTIDSIADELNISRLDIIRCDVQGEELNVIRGAETVIRLWKPIISLRYNKKIASIAKMEIEELVSFMDTLNYFAFFNEKEAFVEYSRKLSLDDAELLFMHKPI